MTTSPDLPSRAVAFVRERFEALRDEDAAPGMAAYLQTEQPFFGVKRPLRQPIERALKKDFEPGTRTEPTPVVSFLERHRGELSGLSLREGSRRLVEAGLMQA